MYRGIREAELMVVPGTSHGLLVEKPDLCNEVIIMQRGRCSGRRHEAARLDSTTLRRLALETTPEPVLA